MGAASATHFMRGNMVCCTNGSLLLGMYSQQIHRPLQAECTDMIFALDSEESFEGLENDAE